MKHSIRYSILERDNNRCRKCNNDYSLDVHHIVERCEGGSDDEDNLITLCFACHYEWHTMKLHLITTFEQWLKIPPVCVIVGVLVREYSEDHVITKFKEAFTQVKDLWMIQDGYVQEATQ